MMRQVLNLHVGWDGRWVADLACGHTLPMGARHGHGPSNFDDLWVAPPTARMGKIGTRVDCAECNP
jgi:hypothetical protein